METFIIGILICFALSIIITFYRNFTLQKAGYDIYDFASVARSVVCIGLSVPFLTLFIDETAWVPIILFGSVSIYAFSLLLISQIQNSKNIFIAIFNIICQLFMATMFIILIGLVALFIVSLIESIFNIS